MTALADLVREIPDYPSPGIVFKDITPVLQSAQALADAVAALGEPFVGRVDVVAAIEARGFILGAPVAVALGAGFVPLRKAGKLPFDTLSEGYTLEYGTSELEVHVDALERGRRVLVVDDVLATGGTAAAAAQLVRRTGADLVGIAVLLEIAALRGRRQLEGVDVHALLAG
ncbi:MAG: adenine phosphoribosyltransferase [Actinomycetota bacterium]|jgi:adenine phosphoribosyltransferase|nr:adenine phosphoribosyltransferase [Actinomycetota bacterium]MDA8293774.1 adenine phosphoribosyltransferase [Actinomycetota bacterium]